MSRTSRLLRPSGASMKSISRWKPSESVKRTRPVRGVVVDGRDLHLRGQQLAGAAHGLCAALKVDVLARDRFDGRQFVRVQLEHPHPERHGLTADEDDAPLGHERLQPAQDALHLLMRKRRLLGHRAR